MNNVKKLNKLNSNNCDLQWKYQNRKYSNVKYNSYTECGGENSKINNKLNDKLNNKCNFDTKYFKINIEFNKKICKYISNLNDKFKKHIGVDKNSYKNVKLCVSDYYYIRNKNKYIHKCFIVNYESCFFSPFYKKKDIIFAKEIMIKIKKDKFFNNKKVDFNNLENNSLNYVNNEIIKKILKNKYLCNWIIDNSNTDLDILSKSEFCGNREIIKTVNLLEKNEDKHYDIKCHNNNAKYDRIEYFINKNLSYYNFNKKLTQNKFNHFMLYLKLLILMDEIIKKKYNIEIIYPNNYHISSHFFKCKKISPETFDSLQVTCISFGTFFFVLYIIYILQY